MKKIWTILFMFCFVPALFASQQKTSDRSFLAAFGHFEKRGFANVFLFPAEWGHLPKAAYGGVFSYPFVGLTHLGGRVFSGLTDIVFLPVAYPFTHYDDSIPVSMGWGEFPWQKGNG